MAASDPLDGKGMRRHNLGLVMRAVADGDRPSRSDVAVALELNGDRFVALGLEIDVDHLSYAVIDLLGRVRDQGSVRRDNRAGLPSATLQTLAELIAEPRRRIAEAGAIVVGATFALPGLVDPHRGMLLVAPNLGWRDAVVDGLRAVFGPADLALRVENEANLAALAERWYGAGRTHRDFVYVSGYIGVGAGLVSNGELHRGETGFCGEFGHCTMEAEGPPCSCGSRGCVEALVGLEALLRRAGKTTSVGTSAHELVEAAERGEPRTLEAIDAVGATLGGPWHPRPTCSGHVRSCSAATSQPWSRGSGRRSSGSCSAACWPSRGRRSTSCVRSCRTERP